MQLLASDSHFSTASIIFSSCGFPKQLPPKPTKAKFAANVCGPVEGQRGGTSKRVSSSRRASSIWCVFPRSANHSLHGPCRVRPSFRSGKATGPASRLRSITSICEWMLHGECCMRQRKASSRSRWMLATAIPAISRNSSEEKQALSPSDYRRQR